MSNKLVVKSAESGKVALRKTEMLFKITDKLLAESRSRDLTVDRSWVEEIVKWSKEFNLGLPETYEELIEIEVIFEKFTKNYKTGF